jgi:hypothetical protein
MLVSGRARLFAVLMTNIKIQFNRCFDARAILIHNLTGWKLQEELN